LTLNGLFPQGLTGKLIVYGYDKPTGRCPANRIKVIG
jgi:hypothetical protein